MNTLLYGNGINIEFGGNQNTNSSIILRAIRSTKKSDYPRHIIIDEPELMVSLMGYLFLEVRNILENEYDHFNLLDDERIALNDFIYRYKNCKSIALTNIGFEDYYLIYDLFCYKNNIVNPEKFDIRQSLKSFFIYSIFNNGIVNSIYKKYPMKLNRFFEQYDTFFTTNYDRNIELFVNKPVYYLHGSFDIKADVYNPNSLRNQISDSALKDYKVDENYFYLYSNVLTTYSGNYKLYMIKMGIEANQSVQKMASGYVRDSLIRKNINELKNVDNTLIKKISEAIRLMAVNPDLQFDETYPINEFESVEGVITIVGLSPNNDTHIFKIINNNVKIQKVIYYFYDKNEVDLLSSLITNHLLEFYDVKELWKEYREVI